jgi:cardiolipin synthase
MDYLKIAEYAVTLIFTLIVAATVFVIITENRNPFRSIAWVSILVLLPIVGILCYFFFGRNYRKQKIISRKSIKKIKKYSDFSGSRGFVIRAENPRQLQIGESETQGIINLLYNNGEAIPYEDNEVKIYTTGSEAFNSLFAAMEKAQHHIHIEFYIIENDVIGNRLKDLLLRKVSEGVRVRLIYDSLGSWRLKKTFLRQMKDGGVEVGSFLKLNLPFFNDKLNYRNHRKIVVVDGAVGFTGGLNIADRYVQGNELGAWRDTLIKITGNAVHGLQSTFLIDWHFVSRIYIVAAEYYPQNTTAGGKLVQTVTSAPDSDWESILQAFCKVITIAKKYVYIETPYFLPPESLLSSIKIAALSGVDVRLLISRNSDARVTNIASRSYLREVMDAGVKVYFYDNGFIHSKTIVADDAVSTIGSTNMDFRSFEMQFEINTFIYDREFAVRMRKIYEADLKNSQRVKLSQWKKRERWQKFKESIARLFSPIL